jgi:hypothetical protein
MSTPKTVCTIARKAEPLEVVASQADRNTASCAPARFPGDRSAPQFPGGRGWPPVHESVGVEMARRARRLEQWCQRQLEKERRPGVV